MADLVEALVDGASEALLHDVDVVVVHDLNKTKTVLKKHSAQWLTFLLRDLVALGLILLAY